MTADLVADRPDYDRHFGRLARRYDELRKDPSDENIEMLVRVGDLERRSVLDVGCGTGRVASVLVLRYGARLVGIDPSAEMLEAARKRAPSGRLRLVPATAEALPFRDHTFERALMQLVVHLVDRARAFAELHRVLSPPGRVVICTVDPAGVDRIWLSDLFPSYADIDRRRFPAPELLLSDLEAAGFSAAWSVPFDQPVVYDRDRALQMLRGRFASSFALIGEDEYRAGLERAERELSVRVEFTLKLAIVTAER